MLVNNDDNDDDCDDGYIDNEEDVRTLKNPALEELSPGTVIPRLMSTLLEVLSPWENVVYSGWECTKSCLKILKPHSSVVCLFITY